MGGIGRGGGGGQNKKQTNIQARCGIYLKKKKCHVLVLDGVCSWLEIVHHRTHICGFERRSSCNLFNVD